MISFENSLEYARQQDQQDPLRQFRSAFHYPAEKNGHPCIYFCGNSLGLQPVDVKVSIEKELNRWSELGVDGWFDETDPWLKYAETLAEPMSKVVGAKPSEVAVMNSLTVNLHLLLSAFYKPTKKRYKILIESDAFPSDRYAFESQLRHHGFDPNQGLLEVTPDDKYCISTEKILSTIEQNADELALVILGGVNYYTGQWFDINAVTKAGKEAGAIVGWDLAHAAGNVPLNLHDDNVDFASWCNYKYLNSGPGSIASIFVHSKYHNHDSTPGLAGWWGQNLNTRFNMRQAWDPEKGAAGWMISTPTILALSCVRSSLDLFEKAGITKLRDKSVKLTGYLEYLVKQIETDRIEIITPSIPDARGAQLSIRVKGADKTLFDKISDKGVIADWREPDVIRIAPVPMYNSFEEVFLFAELLKSEI